MLAAKALKDVGFQLYDLGGFDCSPAMSYKLSVTAVVERQDFIHWFRAARGCTPQQNHRGALCGTIVDQVGVNDLWSPS